MIKHILCFPLRAACAFKFVPDKFSRTLDGL